MCERKRGFTLVELLVVVAVIAILIALLLPALNRARSQAQLVQCMSNQRQVLMALRMYANENPSPGYPWIYETQTYAPTGEQDCQYAWIQALIDGRYLSTSDVTQCTAPPEGFCFAGYKGVWDLTGNSGGEYTPTSFRNGAWLFYTARAIGYPTLGTSGTGLNSQDTWGYWSPISVQAALYHNLNITQNANNFKIGVPAANSKAFVPILSCPYSNYYPSVTRGVGAYFHPFGPGSNEVDEAPHIGNTTVNFGNTDGSVLSLNVKMNSLDAANALPQLNQLYFGTWGYK